MLPRGIDSFVGAGDKEAAPAEVEGCRQRFIERKMPDRRLLAPGERMKECASMGLWVKERSCGEKIFGGKGGGGERKTAGASPQVRLMVAALWKDITEWARGLSPQRMATSTKEGPIGTVVRPLFPV